jgi:hypothetical protein
MLGQLEEVARRVGIHIRYDRIKKVEAFSTGGLCQLRGNYILIINAQAPLDDKIETVAEAVNRFDLSQVYLKPNVREYLERFGHNKKISSEEE